MNTFVVAVVALFFLASPSSAGSCIRGIPDDVSFVICTYLPYKDQCRSFQRINTKSNEIFNVLNQDTIKSVFDSQNEMTSLLHQPASLRRNAAIFKLHRQMMLNEQYSLQCLYGWKQFGRNMPLNDLFGQQMVLEMGTLDSIKYHQYWDTMTLLHGDCPQYQPPYNRTRFDALCVDSQWRDWKHFIDCSRDIASNLYLGPQGGGVLGSRLNLLSQTMKYLHLWDYFYSRDLIPHRHEVFDDEAIHSNSKQMCHLRYLIREFGLMVIHPKHIMVALEHNALGITALYLRNPPIINKKGMSFFEANLRWILDVLNRMDSRDWYTLVRGEEDIQLFLMMKSFVDEPLYEMDGNIRKQVKERFNWWMATM